MNRPIGSAGTATAQQIGIERRPKLARRLRVGCAGWAVASAHRHLFLDGESALARYATLFNIVEINSSFHRPHQRKTYERWAAAVPVDFRFSVKLPRTITHELRLRQSGPLLDRFIDESSGLGDKLGCLLVQLPPTLVFDARLASTFLMMLRRRWSGGIAFEPRHLSWFGAATDALWARHGIARVGVDPALDVAARNAVGSGPVRYWRWHGSPRMYYSDYDENTLSKLAAEVVERTPGGTDAWIIFDNTALGFATPNAARLQDLLDKLQKSHAPAVTVGA